MSMTLTNKKRAMLFIAASIRPHLQASPESVLADRWSPLNWGRNWLDNLEINDPKIAKFIYDTIPAQCPFARDINWFGRTIFSIPPLCKLNPFYEQLVGLRFRAHCYLADNGLLEF